MVIRRYLEVDGNVKRSECTGDVKCGMRVKSSTVTSAINGCGREI